MATSLKADLVLEGGGVRGIGLVGAVSALDEAGYTFPRVAGTSAGSVVGCLVAALQHAGEPMSRLEEIVKTIDYRKFKDSSGLGRVPLVGELLSLLVSDGLYEGAYLEKFLTGALAELGVHTFGDLRTGEEADPYAWSLVVTASDLSRRRLVRLPWDLPAYDVDPDEFPVARAVRASSAIPFFFRPVPVGKATWVDGGLLSNFPVGLFDRSDSVSPRWPTFGVRLSSRSGTSPVTQPVKGPFGIGLAALETLLSDQDAAYIEDPCTVVRTTFVPASGVSAIDFGLTRAQSQTLFDAGLDAGRTFLQTWDFPGYVARCRTVPAEQPAVARTVTIPEARAQAGSPRSAG